jgi:hypothetical protein
MIKLSQEKSGMELQVSSQTTKPMLTGTNLRNALIGS